MCLWLLIMSLIILHIHVSELVPSFGWRRSLTWGQWERNKRVCVRRMTLWKETQGTWDDSIGCVAKIQKLFAKKKKQSPYKITHLSHFFFIRLVAKSQKATIDIWLLIKSSFCRFKWLCCFVLLRSPNATWSDQTSVQIHVRHTIVICQRHKYFFYHNIKRYCNKRPPVLLTLLWNVIL